MHPKKASEVISEYAASKGIPEKDMLQIMGLVYRHMRNIMEAYTDNMIHMEGLGSFKFRVWKIEKEVKRCNSILRNPKVPVGLLEIAQDKRNKLIRMDAMILQAMNEKADTRELKMKMEHVPSELSYKQGCRCKACKMVKSMENLRTAKTRKEKKQREEQRIQRLQEYEDSRQAAKDMGEQG